MRPCRLNYLLCIILMHGSERYHFAMLLLRRIHIINYLTPEVLTDLCSVDHLY